LGNEVLKNLVLMGVTHIVVVDFDIVEMGNLTRCVLFRKSDAERKRLKVEVVAERVHDMNPNMDVKTICGDIAYDVGLGLIRQMDVVIGCVDSRWARFCINRLCMRAGIPWVDGGIDGLEGTVRVFAPGKNCYACNLGPEGLKDLARRMPCSGIIQRQEQVGSAPTTSIIASIIGAIEVQEGLKIIIKGDKEMTSLCGKMMYYDGEHMTVRIAGYQAYDDECPEHEMWTPVRQTAVSDSTPVGEALRCWARELRGKWKEESGKWKEESGKWKEESGKRKEDGGRIMLRLTNDCFVDYVSRRDNDERVTMMVPGRSVADRVAGEKSLDGLPLSALYQHEYHHIDTGFPYPSLTLAQLGIPQHDIVQVTADGEDYYIEVKSEK
jgi:adenylyltransferase/sulfurtransferase